MKNHTAKTVLAWLLGYMVVAGADIRQVVIFANETAVLRELRSFNAIKRASVVHEGTRYHVYSGGRGSAIRTFNAFIFREEERGFVLLSQLVYDPLSEGAFKPIYSLTPEISERGISLLSHAHSARGTVVTTVAQHEFDDLKTAKPRTFSFRFELDQPANQNAEGGTGQPATRPESKSEGSEKPLAEPDGRSR